MDCDLFDLLFDHIDYMINQELLRSLTSSIYPNLKRDDQKKTHKTAMKHAYPSMFNESRAIKSDDLRLI